MYVSVLIACEQGEGEKRRRAPVGMAKVFDFQMPVICHVQIHYSGRKHNNNGLL